MTDVKLFRSVLYLPGSNARALEKAQTIKADALIFDLEDAVSVGAKDSAREQLVQALQEFDYGHRVKLVRTNGIDTPWGADDLAAFSGTNIDGILVPKVSSVELINMIATKMKHLGGYENTMIWAMIETPIGIVNAAAIAQHPRLEGFVIGTNDLASDLRVDRYDDRRELQTVLQHAILAARAGDILAIDGVYNAFRDSDGLRTECEQGRGLGYDGKSLIHPSQVDVANDVFSPSDASIDLAKRQIEAFEAAERAGQGVAVLDGKIVENLHIATARRTLAADSAIRALETK